MRLTDHQGDSDKLQGKIKPICPFCDIIKFNVFQAQYSDVRCKCVCPKGILPKNVFIKFVKIEECKCEKVLPKLKETDCLRCQCKYEARNTTLIKVVVIFIIMSLFILITYMIGVWIHSIWRPRGLSVTSDVIQERLLARSRALSRLDSQVSRWKASVGEQRDNVYNKHSILS